MRDLTGSDPLSVSSSLLAICAMRQWGLDPRGYKGSKPDKLARRRGLVQAIAQATQGWLQVDAATVEQLQASDHLLDALVSALVGRAVVVGVTLPIPEEHQRAAAAEGWIHLPLRQPLAAFDPFVR